MNRFRSWVRYGLLACLGLVSPGCGWWWPFETSIPGSETDGGESSYFPFIPGEQVLGGSADRPPAADEAAEVEPNDDFATAQRVSFTETVRISGFIDSKPAPYDRDLYDLGPAYAGDRVLMDLTVEADEDVVLGVFDDQERLLAYLDQTSRSTGPGQIDLVIREPTSRLYAAAATRSGADLDRPYLVKASLQRDLGEAAEHPQVIVLNFRGAAQVRVGNRAPVDVPPFDAAKISPAFAGQTKIIVNFILQAVRSDFAGLGVAIYLSDDPAIPPGDHSTIYFGTYDNRLLGLADNVDPYNEIYVQSAILYTDTFSVFNVLSPTLEQIAQVLANTTSHEAGHLLGLRHTADPVDLMDTTATARQMMLNQNFKLASLNPTVLPIGKQDAPALLSWTLGGELISARAKSGTQERSIQVIDDPNDFYIPRDWLMDCGCSRCAQP